MNKIIYKVNTEMGHVFSYHHCQYYLWLVVLIQLFFVYGCTSTPADSFLKESAIYSCYGGGRYGDYMLSEYGKDTIKLEKFKVMEKYDKNISDEDYTIYKYAISVHDTKTRLTDNLSCSSAIIKRGSKWYYRIP